MQHSLRKTAFFIAVAFGMVGVAYHWATNAWLMDVLSDGTLRAVADTVRFQTLVDAGFVLASAGVVYWLICLAANMQQRIETSEREHQDQLRQAYDAAQLGTYRYDIASGVVHFDDRAREILRLPKCDFIIEDLRRCLDSEDLARFDRAVAESLKPGADARVAAEIRLRRPGGETIWIGVHARTYFEETASGERRPVRRFATVQDITMRHTADEQLHAKLALEAQLREFAENAPGTVYTYRVGPDGRHTFPYISPRAERLLKVSAAELAQDSAPIFARIHPEDVAQVEASVKAAVESRMPWQATFRIRRADGEYVWLEGRSSPVPEADGGTLWHGFLSDVTDRVRAEEARRESEALLHAMIDNAGAVMWVKDLDGRYLVVNDYLSNLLGKPREALLGRRTQDVFPERAGEELDANTRAVLATGEVQDFEEIIDFPAGRRIYSSTKFPLRDAAGRIYAIGGICMDRTERIQAEAARRETERLLHAIIDSAGAVITVKDRELRYLEINAFAARLAGQPREALLGKRAIDVFAAADAAAYETNDRHVLETGETAEFEEPFSKSGAHGVRASLKFPLRDEAGRIYGVGAISTDITERRRTEAALRESESRLGYALDAIAEGVWDWNMRSGRVRHNAMWGRLLGIDERLLEHSVDEYFARVHEDDRHRVFAENERALASAGEFAAEYRMRRSDGSVIWVRDRGRVVERDEAGRPLRMVGAIADITARRQAEDVLRESEQKLSMLAANVPGILYTSRIQADGTLTYPYVSPRVKEMFGLDPADLARDGQLAFERIHPDDLPRLKDRLARSLQTLTPWHDTYRMRNAAGEYRWIEGRGTRERLADGSTLSYGFIFDITDRRRTEVALRESEERLRQASEAADLGTFGNDLVNDVVLTDEAFRRQFSLNDGRTTRAQIFARIHPEDVELVNRVHREAGASEDGRYHVEHRLLHPDGHITWVALHGKVVFEGTGAARRPVKRFGNTQDITGRMQAEMALRESEQTLRRAQEMARLGSWSIDVTTGKSTRSEMCDRILGLPAGDIGVREVLDVIHPDDRARARAEWLRALRGAPYDIECRTIVDGEVRWMHIKAEMIFDGGERPVRAVGMTQDITEVRLAQHALVAHQEQLEHLVQVRTAELANANFKLIAQTERLADLYDNAPCGYHSLHADGTFMTINDTELRWLGYRRDEVVGRMNIQEIMSPPTLLVFEERMRQLQRHGQLQGLESEYRRKDGSYLPVMINITSVRDADGAITQIRVTVFDISDRKAAELARARALQEAERLARVRSDFLANMSHEIRTPLNAVLGLAQVGMHGSPGPAAETFSRILNSGEVLLGVVNDVLDFSKIEAGRLELEHVHFGLGECIDRAVDITAGPAFAKDLDFRLDEAADLPVSCRGDALRLAQVLINLLSNAVKFTERGGVSLAVRRAAGELSFAVTDTGIGMSEEQVGRLFQPFEQADTSTTRRFGGSGLGLAISKRLVEMMHGRLEVTSKPGAGSTFTVHIPLADPVERDALQHAGMALAGLADAEAGPLLADLQRRGVPGQVCTLAEALRSDAHGIVVDVAVVRDGVNARAVLDAVGSRAIAIACKPGENGFLEELHNRVPLCQRPLSARRVLAACRAGVPAHEHPRKGQRLDGVRILAAEDNEMNQVVLEEMLLAEGAALTVVDNGRLALERLRASRGADFDILVTDIQMPEMDGYETARSARTLAPGLPVIGLTAHAMPEERQRCLDAGMVDHVTKPVLQETLVAAILRHRRRAGPAAPEALAHPAPKPQPATLIDWSAMESRFSGKRAFVDRLASTALRTYADYPADLRKAAAASDFKAIGFIAHGMRGTAWSLSANGLRELSARTEDAAKKATPETLVLARELAVAIEQLLAELAQRQAQTVA